MVTQTDVSVCNGKAPRTPAGAYLGNPDLAFSSTLELYIPRMKIARGWALGRRGLPQLRMHLPLVRREGKAQQVLSGIHLRQMRSPLTDRPSFSEIWLEPAL